jgi:BMFP domain-containing protein YqiC
VTTLRDVLTEKIDATRDELDDLERRRDRLDNRPVRFVPHEPPQERSREELLQIHRDAWTAAGRSVRPEARTALQAMIQRNAERLPTDDTDAT